MKARSIKGISPGEIRIALDESMKDGFAPTLAIVFLSIKQDRNEICKMLDERSIAIFGATTAGEFIDGEINSGSISIMLLNMDRSSFEIVLKQTSKSNTLDISKEIGQKGIEKFQQAAFIIASGGLLTEGDLIIQGIQKTAGESAVIFGGMAGDDLTATGTYVFTNKIDSGDGLIALIIDQTKVQVSGLGTSGWQPVGTVRTITKSEGLTVYTIDNEPALDLLGKFMGLEYDNETPADVIYNLGDFFPVQLLKNNRPYVLRETRAINIKDRSITFTGSVPEGSKIRFSLPPDLDIVDHIKSDCTRLKEEQQKEAEAMIIFSCSSRLQSLGPMMEQEIEEIKNVWGSPLVGFFSYGEIGRSMDSETAFHNNTCCVVVFKEKLNQSTDDGQQSTEMPGNQNTNPQEGLGLQPLAKAKTQNSKLKT